MGADVVVDGTQQNLKEVGKQQGMCVVAKQQGMCVAAHLYDVCSDEGDKWRWCWENS